MKKIILISAVTISFLSCKKDESKSASNEVVCMFSDRNGIRTFEGCAKNNSEVQQKAIELRNMNFDLTETNKKSTCSECQ